MGNPERPDEGSRAWSLANPGSEGDPLLSRAGPDGSVGARIRQRRQALGMSQIELARMLGAAPQQLRRYERGLDRVSPAHLSALATALRVPISYFFRQGAAN